MTKSSTAQLLKKLEAFDTPTITNVVASYPKNKSECLGLYDPWAVNWFTDQSLRCIYPELGPKAGNAVTVVYGMPDPNYTRYTFQDVLNALAAAAPAVLVIRQDLPERIRCRNGLVGGNMTTAMKRVGCVGCVSDGPSRDIGEIREIGDFQLMLTGVAPGHGAFSIKAINVPVSVCSMDVCPGEIVHMDENGACKFPADRLEEVLALCEKLEIKEKKQMKTMRECKDTAAVWDVMNEKPDR